jgi:hypothetical protein
MNTVGVSILILTLVVVIFAPRRWAVLGMMAGVLYITQGQKIDVFGFNLYAHRFLEMAGFGRVIIKREISSGGLNKIDRALILLYFYTTVVYLIRSNEPEAYQIGLAVDASLCYFSFRGLIRDMDDFRWFLRSFVFLLVPYLILVSIEGITGDNPFTVMGVPEHLFRGGKIRCIGSFRHPDLLGTLGASFLPLYIGLALAKIKPTRALVGIVVCISIVLASNSGLPIACAATGLVGWMLWPLRRKMFLVRGGLLVLVIFLAIFMKAPIWYLPAKISSLTGGGGFHRSYLMEMAIRDFDKWWLAGIPIKETAGWFPYTLKISGGADITNQFLSFGISAGLGAVALFILILVLSFKRIGKALEVVRSRSSECEMILWGLGVMLSIHIVNWFGVSYFDQINVVWFLQLAAISSILEISSSAQPAPF